MYIHIYLSSFQSSHLASLCNYVLSPFCAGGVYAFLERQPYPEHIYTTTSDILVIPCRTTRPDIVVTLKKDMQNVSIYSIYILFRYILFLLSYSLIFNHCMSLALYCIYSTAHEILSYFHMHF